MACEALSQFQLILSPIPKLPVTSLSVCLVCLGDFKVCCFRLMSSWLSDNSVSSLVLPQSACVQLIDTLQHSTLKLPTSLMKAGDMFVSNGCSHFLNSARRAPLRTDLYSAQTKRTQLLSFFWLRGHNSPLDLFHLTVLMDWNIMPVTAKAYLLLVMKFCALISHQVGFLKTDEISRKHN